MSASVAVLAPDPGPARGYLVLCLLNGVIYLVVAAAILILHLHENAVSASAALPIASPHLVALGGAAGSVALALALHVATALALIMP